MTIDSSRQLEELRRVLLRPEALVDKISPVIDDILRQQIAEAPDEVAQALSPVIGEALRRQVYQAREDVVDALYPVIGDTINRAMADAIQQLAQRVDTSMRQKMVLPRPLRALQARRHGVSLAELELRQGLPFAIREVFLIQRESGLLISHWSDAAVPADRELISGMLTAIRAFAREAFGNGDQGELGAISYERQRILLEAGGAAYLAVVIEGVEPANLRPQLREALIRLHNLHYDQLKQFDGADDIVLDAAARLVSAIPQAAARQTKSGALSRRQLFLLVALVMLVVLPPLFGCGWWVWRIEARFAALAALPAPPSATPSPTPAPSATPAPSPTATATATATAMPTATSTATATPRPSTTPLPTATPIPQRGVLLGNVYLHSSPGGASRSGVVAPRGALVEVVARDGEWFRARVAITDDSGVELTGWILVEWVRLIDENTPTPPSP